MGQIAHAIQSSSCITVIVLQHAAEPLSALDSAGNFAYAGVSVDQPVAKTLMIALSVIMLNEFDYRSA